MKCVKNNMVIYADQGLKCVPVSSEDLYMDNPLQAKRSLGVS